MNRFIKWLNRDQEHKPYLTAEAQSAQREIYFFVYREIPIDENDPCENLTAQNIFVCRYLPTNKNLSLCALCLCGESANGFGKLFTFEQRRGA